jgi:hypothetical protein
MVLEVWVWRRKLLAWEEELVVKCRTMRFDVTTQEFAPDVWQWHPNVGDGYIVLGVYQMLMRQEMHNYDALSVGICHIYVASSFYAAK